LRHYVNRRLRERESLWGHGNLPGDAEIPGYSSPPPSRIEPVQQHAELLRIVFAEHALS
jgi:hypothetical protein